MEIWVIVVIAYTAWAIYSGWRFISGRIGFLEENRVVSKILKVICSIIVGYIIGAFQLIVLILRAITFFWR